VELGIGITYVLKYDFSFFVMNTLLKTVGEQIGNNGSRSKQKEFEKYDGSFEKLKTDKNSTAFNRNVSGGPI